MAEEILDIVDENDAVVGQRTRSDIHKLGLPHREVHVWFVSPAGEVLFQRRGPTKDTYPNLLDATVGGHVDPGESYLEAALREIGEETGLRVGGDSLREIVKLRTFSFDDVRQVHNNPFRTSYLHIFKGDAATLRVEATDASGFVALHLDNLVRHRADIVPNLTSEVHQPLWDKIRTML